MSRRAANLVFLSALLLLTTGHVGSPDVWYEGEAGPYHVVVYVRVPGVIPGIADIQVQVPHGKPDEVTAVVNLFSSVGTPPPDVARPTGSGGWYQTRLWIMSPGSNSVTVAVRGREGAGSVVVPVSAVASRRLALNAPLGLALAGLGVVLFAGAVTISGAAVREGVLPPGQQAGPDRVRRARWVMAGTAAALGLLLLGGKRWWDATDAEFRRDMYRPLSAVASVDAGMLRFDITDSTWVMRADSAWLRSRHLGAWSPLVMDHGKLMHLFLVRSGDMGAFAHLHPVTTDSVHFAVRLPPLPPGRYRVFGDIVHASGFSATLVAAVDLPGGAPANASSTGAVSVGTASIGTATGTDDAAYLGGGHADLDSLADGGTIDWKRGPALVKGQPEVLTFDVREPDGSPAALEPYLGMSAHAVVARSDGAVFIHLHPMGTISTASQASFLPRGSGSGDTAMAGAMSMSRMPENGQVTFPYAFPEAGRYRIWVQVKRRGRIQTAAFDADVAQPS